MPNEYPIRQAAELAGLTAEALRHYDRIGLVLPYRTDRQSGYRYYSDAEVIRLRTVRLLSCMGLPLRQIRTLLSLSGVEQIAGMLEEAERSADRKIAELCDARARIRRAKQYYLEKAALPRHPDSPWTERLPERVILLSATLHSPSVETLWNYHRHFYAQLGEDRRADFLFADTAGIYTAGTEEPRLFAVCTRYPAGAAPGEDGLLTLPAGPYLCADCREDEREAVRQALLRRAAEATVREPGFALQMIVLSGILQWEYRVQVYLGEPAG